jgi:hypothetical protein
METGASDPNPVDSALDYNDEFDVNSIDSWTLRHETENEPAQYTLLDINTTTVGRLTIQPLQTPGWFSDGKAPLIYKRVTGNFSIESSITTQSIANSSLPPTLNFNSAGLMARNTSGLGENYVMLNVGRQRDTIENGLGTEFKSTVSSTSALQLQSGSNNGRLTLCRVGNSFTMYRLLDNETGWTQIGSVIRDDFPATVQVGMVVNAFSGADLTATFDYVRMIVPQDELGCVAN